MLKPHDELAVCEWDTRESWWWKTESESEDPRARGSNGINLCEGRER